jgi:hypothetical protein
MNRNPRGLEEEVFVRANNKQLSGVTALVALMTVLYASSALAGANRWTAQWPYDAYVNRVATDPTNPDVLYALTGSGLSRSGNGGLSWSDPSTGPLEGVAVHCLTFNPAVSSNLYAGTSRGVIESTDGGVTWSDRLAAQSIYSIVIGGEKIYAADFDETDSDYPGPSKVYASTDKGATWTTSSVSAAVVPGGLAVDPSRPSTLYAGMDAGEFGPDEFVIKSVDGGVTWSSLVGGNAIAIDPQNPAAIYVGTRHGVNRSLDAGSTWTFLSSGLEDAFVFALAIDPRRTSTIYAGTFGGVFRSTDSGLTWHPFNKGLTDTPNLYVSSLSINSTGSELHVTIGGEVFDYQILSGALDISVAADNNARFLVADSEGRLVFRTVNSSGSAMAVGPFGPYSNWFPRAVADGPDRLTRVLWNNDDGSAALWLVDANGANQASHRLGPVQGWTAVDVSAGAPGMTHVLWAHADGRVGFWAVDNSGRVSLGPKWMPEPGWTAVAIADGTDGLTRLLWNGADGTGALSLVGPGGLLATHSWSGSGGWRAADVAVGAGGQARILWANADGRLALFRVDDQGNVTARGPVYQAPEGFAAQRVGAGPNGLTQILLTDVNGSALLWQMSADNVYLQSFPVRSNCQSAAFAPLTGRTPVGMHPGRCLSFTPDGQP